jgi:hypothetical protein
VTGAFPHSRCVRCWQATRADMLWRVGRTDTSRDAPAGLPDLALRRLLLAEHYRRERRGPASSSNIVRRPRGQAPAVVVDRAAAAEELVTSRHEQGVFGSARRTARRGNQGHRLWTAVWYTPGDTERLRTL